MQKMLRYIALLGCVLATGCSMLPEIAHQPMLHNPYPQLSKVAVAPFFNLSAEPTLDGRRVALAYYNELQSVPGFEVVPVEVVEAENPGAPDRPARSGRRAATWPKSSAWMPS